MILKRQKLNSTDPLAKLQPNTQARTLLFVDDSKLSKRITDHLSSTDIQHTLDLAIKWAPNNGMSFNQEKFQVILYGPSQEWRDLTNYKDELGNLLPKSTSVKDLGVTQDQELTFNEHQLKTIAKGCKLSGLVFRIFRNRTMQMIQVFKSNISPTLGSKPLHQIVEEYAHDLNVWIADFIPTMEKMMSNGYADGDLIGRSKF